MALNKRVRRVYWHEHWLHTRLEKERSDTSLHARQHRILQEFYENGTELGEAL